jgi:hypothetical protein
MSPTSYHRTSHFRWNHSGEYGRPWFLDDTFYMPFTDAPTAVEDAFSPTSDSAPTPSPRSESSDYDTRESEKEAIGGFIRQQGPLLPPSIRRRTSLRYPPSSRNFRRRRDLQRGFGYVAIGQDRVAAAASSNAFSRSFRIGDRLKAQIETVFFLVFSGSF